MAKSQDEGRDVLDRVLGHKVTGAEAAGKTLIPDGTYNDCTVNIIGAKEFTDEDTGQTTTKVSVKFSCPDYDGDLTARLKLSFHKKAGWAKLLKATFPEREGNLEGIAVKDLNGRRVNMITQVSDFNGNAYNEFTFTPCRAAASAKK